LGKNIGFVVNTQKRPLKILLKTSFVYNRCIFVNRFLLKETIEVPVNEYIMSA
jgi:hypothetical protein